MGHQTLTDPLKILKVSKGFQLSVDDQKFVSTGQIICMTSHFPSYSRIMHMKNS